MHGNQAPSVEDVAARAREIRLEHERLGFGSLPWGEAVQQAVEALGQPAARDPFATSRPSQDELARESAVVEAQQIAARARALRQREPGLTVPEAVARVQRDQD